MNIKKLEQIYDRTPVSTLMVYVILRILMIVCFIRQMMLGSYVNAFLCLLSMALFALPFMTEELFALKLPSGLQISIFLFIFAAEILGEINNFYGAIPFWDTMLHTINGFLCASIGFNLVDLLNSRIESRHMSPIFMAIIAFCFSMTIGVCWEFFEFSNDYFLRNDMQKDRIIQTVSSIELNETGENVPIVIRNVDHTILYDAEGNELQVIEGGYLDIGIIDTMKDLFVNLIGALVFSVLGYLYISNREKYMFAGKFQIRFRKHRIET